MKLFKTIESWRQFRARLPKETKLGFVPTMGNLHAGHKSLFVRSNKENDYTATTLFVNPTQFNQQNDFEHYPRTLEADIELMQEARVDFCILPAKQEMYADGYKYQIHEHELCHLMEGIHRPGHFTGMLTVVMKLLQLIKPTTAYFGEKDYQQYLLIKGMVEAFFMDITITACPTVRESSGLAYSSRNNRFSQEQKAVAEQFARLFHQKKPDAELLKQLKAQGIEVEYIEEHHNRRFAAVVINGIRLIDNYAL